MRRKHKKGVVSSVYDYIFFLHPSSSDPRATILLVSDAGCLTMYKRARYSRPILNLAFACSIIHMTCTHTCIICTEKPLRCMCWCAGVLVRMSVRSTAWIGISRAVASLSCQRLWQADRETFCPPSMFRTVVLAMKDCFDLVTHAYVFVYTV